jgi:hypothetical protein
MRLSCDHANKVFLLIWICLQTSLYYKNNVTNHDDDVNLLLNLYSFQTHVIHLDSPIQNTTAQPRLHLYVKVKNDIPSGYHVSQDPFRILHGATDEFEQVR